MPDVYHPTKLPFKIKLLEEVHSLLKNANNILIFSHRGPDGDTIGANLALKNALQNQWGKKVTSACVDPPPGYSHILKGALEYVNDFNPKDYDLYVSVDCGASYMLKFHEKKPEIFDKSKPFINIDHHPSNDDFGTHNLVDSTAAAACFTIHHLLKYLGLTITPDIATALLLGIYYDTGSFMHSNTSKEAMKTAGELISRGSDHKKIIKTLFHTTPLSQLKLLGLILKRAQKNSEGNVISAVTGEDFEKYGTKPEETGGAIDYLNSVKESRLAILLTEDRKGNIKASMRTQRDDLDLTGIAGKFGGGGHKKASGFTIRGKLIPEITWKVKM